MYAFSLSIHVATGEGLDRVPKGKEPMHLALVHAIQERPVSSKLTELGIDEPPTGDLVELRLPQLLPPDDLCLDSLLPGHDIHELAPVLLSIVPHPLTHSYPNCPASIDHSCFHVYTSSLLQLNALFLAMGSTTAQICCSVGTGGGGLELAWLVTMSLRSHKSQVYRS